MQGPMTAASSHLSHTIGPGTLARVGLVGAQGILGRVYGHHALRAAQPGCPGRLVRHVAPSQEHQRHLHAELALQVSFGRCLPDVGPMLGRQARALCSVATFGQHRSALTYGLAKMLTAAWQGVAALSAGCLGSAAQAQGASLTFGTRSIGQPLVALLLRLAGCALLCRALTSPLDGPVPPPDVTGDAFGCMLDTMRAIPVSAMSRPSATMPLLPWRA